MSSMAPRVRGPAVWLTLCFAVSGTVGGLLSHRFAPEANIGLLLFWVLAWGCVGVAGGLALRASRRR